MTSERGGGLITPRRHSVQERATLSTFQRLASGSTEVVLVAVVAGAVRVNVARRAIGSRRADTGGAWAGGQAQERAAEGARSRVTTNDCADW